MLELSISIQCFYYCQFNSIVTFTSGEEFEIRVNVDGYLFNPVLYK